MTQEHKHNARLLTLVSKRIFDSLTHNLKSISIVGEGVNITSSFSVTLRNFMFLRSFIVRMSGFTSIYIVYLGQLGDSVQDRIPVRGTDGVILVVNVTERLVKDSRLNPSNSSQAFLYSNVSHE
jgi:hypothetical protein